MHETGRMLDDMRREAVDLNGTAPECLGFPKNAAKLRKFWGFDNLIGVVDRFRTTNVTRVEGVWLARVHNAAFQSLVEFVPGSELKPLIILPVHSWEYRKDNRQFFPQSPQKMSQVFQPHPHRPPEGGEADAPRDVRRLGRRIRY